MRSGTYSLAVGAITNPDANCDFAGSHFEAASVALLEAETRPRYLGIALRIAPRPQVQPPIGSPTWRPIPSHLGGFCFALVHFSAFPSPICMSQAPSARPLWTKRRARPGEWPGSGTTLRAMGWTLTLRLRRVTASRNNVREAARSVPGLPEASGG